MRSSCMHYLQRKVYYMWPTIDPLHGLIVVEVNVGKEAGN